MANPSESAASPLPGFEATSQQLSHYAANASAFMQRPDAGQATLQKLTELWEQNKSQLWTHLPKVAGGAAIAYLPSSLRTTVGAIAIGGHINKNFTVPDFVVDCAGAGSLMLATWSIAALVHSGGVDNLAGTAFYGALGALWIKQKLSQ